MSSYTETLIDYLFFFRRFISLPEEEAEKECKKEENGGDGKYCTCICFPVV